MNNIQWFRLQINGKDEHLQKFLVYFLKIASAFSIDWKYTSNNNSKNNNSKKEPSIQLLIGLKFNLNEDAYISTSIGSDVAPFKYLAIDIERVGIREKYRYLETLNILPYLYNTMVSYKFLISYNKSKRSELYDNLLHYYHFALKRGISLISLKEHKCIIDLGSINIDTENADLLSYILALILVAILSGYSRISVALRQVASQTLAWYLYLKGFNEVLVKLLVLLAIEYYYHLPIVLHNMSSKDAEFAHAIVHSELIMKSDYLRNLIFDICVFHKAFNNVCNILMNILRRRDKIKLIDFIGKLTTSIRDNFLKRLGENSEKEALLGRLSYISSKLPHEYIKNSEIDRLFIIATEQLNIALIALLMQFLIDEKNTNNYNFEIFIVYTPQTTWFRLILEDIIELSRKKIFPANTSDVNVEIKYILLAPDTPLINKIAVAGLIKKLHKEGIDLNKIFFLLQGNLSLIVSILNAIKLCRSPTDPELWDAIGNGNILII